MSKANSYEKLLKLKHDTRSDYFSMALAYFFDIGYQTAENITDEQIASCKEQPMFTKDFCEWLMRTARDIASWCESAVEVVQFCQAEDIFDTIYYAEKLRRFQLEDMLKARIANERHTPMERIKDFCEKYDCDADNFAMLGFEIPEDEDE